MKKSGLRSCLTFVVLVGLASFVVGQEKWAVGVVFEDRNRNGFLDPGEKGVPNVVVSNQREAVQTDPKGRYLLPLEEETIIFVSKPSGYQVPLNENGLPQFYYIHQPKGSSAGLKYPGVEPTGDFPESLDFPLYKGESKNSFLALITGDPQPRDEWEVGYFEKDIVEQMAKTRAQFYLALGDIAYDDLTTYRSYNRAVKKLGIPAYNVHGNHDMNFDAPDDRHAAETFKRTFGPEYYSFNHGKVHFVVLDDVDYAGWNTETGQKGSYRAYLSEKQLTWLRNDLAFVPEDHLIVLTMHIPIASEALADHQLVNRDELFEILKFREHVLALYAHLHMLEHTQFTAEHGWKGTADFRGISLGAACGAWWSGPKDERGIPESFCLDGMPNGYFVFSFEGNRYNYHFYPANHPADYQLRVVSPSSAVKVDSLKSAQLVVNVFVGDPSTTVVYALGNGSPVRMARTVMKDPAMVEYFQNNRATFASWIQDIPPSRHLWTAPLPTDLTPGNHSLRIRAVDYLGNIYTDEHTLQVVK